MKRQSWMYGFLVLFVAAGVELLAFIAIQFLTHSGIVYDHTAVQQPYAEYMLKRHARLGWISRKADTAPDGTRPDPAYSIAAPVCISLFGDSFTWSNDVDGHEAWGAILSKKLSCRVANYGVGGYGSDQAYLRFLSEDTQGQVVFLNHLSENILRNVNQYRNLIYPGPDFAFKPRFIIESGRLKLVPTPNIAASEVEHFLKDPGRYLEHEYFLPGGDSGIQTVGFPHTLSLAKLLLGNYHILAKIRGEPRHSHFYSAGHPSGGLAVTFRILRAFVNDAEARGQYPIITIIPTCDDLRLFQSTGVLPYVELAGMIRAEGLTFIDFGEEIGNRLGSAEPASLYATCSGHFNRAGYRMLADIAFTFLSTAAELKTRSQL